MAMLRLLMLLSLAILVSPVQAGEMFRWVDANGRVHFGDKPPAGARAQGVEVRQNVYQSVPLDSGAVAGPRDAVVIYTTEWCGVCRKAKAYLKGKAIPYTEHDVEKSQRGREEYRRLQGRGVPIILVGDQRMDGFSATRLGALLKAGGHAP